MLFQLPAVLTVLCHHREAALAAVAIQSYLHRACVRYSWIASAFGLAMTRSR
jgi:hypothetical protein